MSRVAVATQRVDGQCGRMQVCGCCFGCGLCAVWDALGSVTPVVHCTSDVHARLLGTQWAPALTRNPLYQGLIAIAHLQGSSLPQSPVAQTTP